MHTLQLTFAYNDNAATYDVIFISGSTTTQVPHLQNMPFADAVEWVNYLNGGNPHRPSMPPKK